MLNPTKLDAATGERLIAAQSATFATFIAQSYGTLDPIPSLPYDVHILTHCAFLRNQVPAELDGHTSTLRG